MTRTRAVIPALGLLSALALGACSGDDPEPRFAPPSTTAPSSPETTPVVEVMGPVETVRAWVEAQNVALKTGDTTDLKALSAPTCRGCNDFIKPIARVYRDGGHFATAGWTVLRAEARDPSTDPAVVHAGVSIAGGRTVAKAGAAPVVYEEEKRILLFKTTVVDGRTLVSFVGFVE